MKLYKLTDSEGKTHQDTQWGEKKTYIAKKLEQPKLCTGTVIHAYRDKNLAFLLNPIHANYTNPILWEAEGEIIVEDWDKVGCSKLTTIKKLSNPLWTDGEDRMKVRAKFAILCAEAVLHLYEKNYPNDKRVRQAIQAAKNYLLAPTKAAGAAGAAAWAAGATAGKIDFIFLASQAVKGGKE